MTPDFVGFIDANCTLSTDKKTAMLDDFCAQYGYQETITGEDGREIPNPGSKKDFANEKIKSFIVQTINARRVDEARAAVQYDVFSLH